MSSNKNNMASRKTALARTSETLLLNDIFTDKVLALRENMMEFLQVLPYQTYNEVFNEFLERTKNMAIEGQRVGAQFSRLDNLTQIAVFDSKPSAANFHDQRSSTATSTMSSDDGLNSAFKAPKNKIQRIENENPFKPAESIHVEPTAVIAGWCQSTRTAQSLLVPVTEENHYDDVPIPK